MASQSTEGTASVDKMKEIDSENGEQVAPSVPAKKTESNASSLPNVQSQTGQEWVRMEDVVWLQQSLDQAEKGINLLKKKKKQLEDNKMNVVSSYTTTKEELGRLQQKYSEMEKTHQMYCTRVEGLERELVACKDKIFSLQPPSQVTDSEILRGWKALCAQIDQWIDDESGGMDDVRPLLIEGRLENGSLKSSIERLEKLERSDGLISGNPCILDGVIRAMIYDILLEEILAENVSMPGLTPEMVELLFMLEKSLEGLEPRRDPAIIDLWKSETLQAMRASDSFAQRQNEAASIVTEHVYLELGPLLSKLESPDSKAMSHFHDEVVMAAVKLASTMRCSSTSYFGAFTENASLLYQSDFNRYQIRDARSGMLLKLDNPSSKEKGAIGDRILTVQPGLYKRPKRAESFELQKPIVLARIWKHATT